MTPDERYELRARWFDALWALGHAVYAGRCVGWVRFPPELR